MRGPWFLLGCLSLTACKFPELPPIDEDAAARHRIAGVVNGLWTGATLQLRVTAEGEQLDTASVADEGAFEFASSIAANITVDVEVAQEPDRHDCIITNGAQRLVAGDIADIDVRCTTDIPVDVQLHAPLEFVFDPQVTRHRLELSLLQTELTLIVNAPVTANVQVAGRPAPIGVTAEAVLLPYGQSEVPVDVAIDGLSRRYVIDVDRGAVAAAEYQLVTASNAETDDYYGEALAADRDRIVIGAIGEDSSGLPGDNSRSASGAVYVYRRNGAAWIQESYLKGTQTLANRILGFSVAMQGDVIVSGAHGVDAAGAVYVFRREPTGWVQQSRLVSPQTSTSDGFGFAVSVDGGRIAASDIAVGAVHLYAVDGISWSYQTTVTSSDIVFGDRFGHRLILNGDRLVVAAPGESSGATGVSSAPGAGTGAPGSGAVYVFRLNGSVWGLEAFIKASNVMASGGFGDDVALSEDGRVLAVGATAREDVHIFELLNGTWMQTAKVRSASASQGFGKAVSVRHDILAIAEPSANRVALFRRSDTTWLDAGQISGINSQPNDRFGAPAALTSEGLVVGAPGEATGAGASHVAR